MNKLRITPPFSTLGEWGMKMKLVNCFFCSACQEKKRNAITPNYLSILFCDHAHQERKGMQQLHLLEIWIHATSQGRKQNVAISLNSIGATPRPNSGSAPE